MKVTGIITTIYPVASGTGKTGKEWRRQKCILTYDNSKPEFPKSVAFDVMGDNIEHFNLQQGSSYEVELDFTTREYQGKVYMDATCWKATAQ